VPVLHNIAGSQNDVPEFTTVEHQPMEEFRLASTLGFTNLPSGKSVARTVPLIFRYRGEIVPSFVLQAVMLWLQLTPDDIKIETGSHIAMGDKVTIPIDGAGNMRVDFKSPFARFGFDDLLLAVELTQAKRTAAISPDTVKNKLALLARTDRAARTLQLPTRRAGSPGELFAAAIATIQNKTFIRRVSPVCDAAILVVLTALSWFFLRWKKRAVLTISTVTLIVYLFASITIFGAYLVWLPIVMPAGTLIFAVIFRWLAPQKI
jgi:hypothetical protein